MKAKAPKLSVHLTPIVDIFTALRSEAINTNNGIGEIPVTKAIVYLQWLGVDDVYQMLEIIRAMDQAFVGAHNEKVKKKLDKANGRNKIRIGGNSTKGTASNSIS